MGPKKYGKEVVHNVSCGLVVIIFFVKLTLISVNEFLCIKEYLFRHFLHLHSLQILFILSALNKVTIMITITTIIMWYSK